MLGCRVLRLGVRLINEGWADRPSEAPLDVQGPKFVSYFLYTFGKEDTYLLSHWIPTSLGPGRFQQFSHHGELTTSILALGTEWSGHGEEKKCYSCWGSAHPSFQQLLFLIWLMGSGPGNVVAWSLDLQPQVGAASAEYLIHVTETHIGLLLS